MSDDAQVPPSFPPESIKIIAESIGISAVGDDVAKELAEEATFRIKHLIQVRPLEMQWWTTPPILLFLFLSSLLSQHYNIIITASLLLQGLLLSYFC